mgnify:CR=1 FL=1
MHMLIISIALVTSAFAEDSEFEGTEEAGQAFEETETKVSVEIGGALAAGNTQFWTLNGLAAASQKWSRNQLAGELGANLGQGIVDSDEDGILSNAERRDGRKQTAKKYWAEMRYDRFVGVKDSLYVLGGALVDPFSGYDLRAHEQLGYSRILLETDTRILGEFGFDVAQELYVEGIDPRSADIIAVRVMFGIDHWFNENVSAIDTIEAYENVIDPNDIRVLNEFAVTSRLSDLFGLKLSHKLSWDNRPVEGFRKTDHTALATIVATIL